MNKLLSWSRLLLLALLFSGCTNPVQEAVRKAPDAGTTLRDAKGAVIDFQRLPRRIVALDAISAALIVALGGGDRLVGLAEGVQPLDSLNHLPAISFEPAFDLDALRALRPDAILVSPLVFSEQARVLGETLQAPAVFVPADSFGAAPAALRMLGPLVGRPTYAAHLADSIEFANSEILKGVQPRMSEKPLSVLVITGESPYQTVNDQTFLGGMLTYLGAENPFARDKERYPILRTEVIEKLNPDVIILLTTDDQSARRFLDASTQIPLLKAVQNQRLYVADPNLVQQPSLRTPDALALFATFLYPKQ